tara:strand:- start:427 stop:741 length:315 start_codon:yes stop_codon:yes gene_type:complete
MNYRDINSASQTLRRNVQDINLEPNNRKALESVMVALAAGGRVQEMALIAQMLEKTSSNVDLTSAIQNLNQVIGGLVQPDNASEDKIKALEDEVRHLKAQPLVG